MVLCITHHIMMVLTILLQVLYLRHDADARVSVRVLGLGDLHPPRHLHFRIPSCLCTCCRDCHVIVMTSYSTVPLRHVRGHVLSDDGGKHPIRQHALDLVDIRYAVYVVISNQSFINACVRLQEPPHLHFEWTSDGADVLLHAHLHAHLFPVHLLLQL